MGAYSLIGMSGRELLNAFWAAMEANDWHQAAGYLTPDCVVDWPCSGEQIVGPRDFAAVQADYPTDTGRWRFDVHRIVDGGGTVVSEVTVSDDDQAARLIAFSDVRGDRIAHQVEYWPTAYDPEPGRSYLTRPTERIP